MSTGRQKVVGWSALLVLLAVGTGLRCWAVGADPFWDDEAESSINAQAILDHGLPTDHFLGQPVYENIMLRPWPGHAEYEFKDLSYSARGVTVYHGWLPLYTIAGSMALFGQGPDHLTDSLKPQHTVDSVRRRTVVPRLPAVVFGLVFMVLMFVLGRHMGGPAAGWAALMYAAVAKKNVYYGSQARYYSLTLVCIAGCGWALWRILRHGRWRDYLVGSVMVVLLFHTHAASCFAMCLVGGLTLPWQRRHERVWTKIGASLLIVMAGTLPWVWWTGYISNMHGTPLAWRMPGFLDVVIKYPTHRPVELGLFVIGLTVAALASAFTGRMPRRLVESFGVRRGAYTLLSVWAGVMFLVFIWCIPAASFFFTRLSLMIAVPCMLLGAMIVSGAACMVSQRWASVVAPGAVLVILLSTGRVLPDSSASNTSDRFEPIRTVLAYLEDADLPQDTRLYATPNWHLIVTYYTGLPIQNIAPIRKTYLDNYPGPIVLLRKERFVPPVDWREIRSLAESAGAALTPDQARDWSERLSSLVQRSELAAQVARVSPPADEPIPPYLQPTAARQRQRTDRFRELMRWHTSSTLMFRGNNARTSMDWWQTYHYKFVDPDSRSGANANFADRFRSALAVPLPRGRCIVYHCPALKPATNPGGGG